ncbi:LacI family DNA-binding transcriptional regulator, partial [Pseudomonas sp. TNT3]|uniref:LacI family DNA-binding transcriptional regulator n=1 Tax=Pseudomonas sp. TNT3 TaxID=2654097 RepID=UPI001FF5D684
MPNNDNHRPTIADVADAAGVSRTTVSHALNDRGQVDPLTRARVKEVAASLG